MAQSPVRIVPQGEILKGTPEPPQLRLPDPRSYFSDRARRLGSLAAKGHKDAAFLQLIEQMAHAQQAALDAHPRPNPPPASQVELSRQHGLPLLAKDGKRDPTWRAALKVILEAVDPGAPAPVRAVIRRLRSMNGEALEGMADRVLGLDYPELDPAAVPFVAAALQVHWVGAAAALGEAAFGKLDIANLCPVCGSPPVASALRLTPVPGVRYLHCVLCGADWQMPRGQCVECESREKVAYFHIESAPEAVKAESCEECRIYLKLVNMEKDPQVDPVADDLATLALDILMDDSGFQRASPNFFFVPGQG